MYFCLLTLRAALATALALTMQAAAEQPCAFDLPTDSNPTGMTARWQFTLDNRPEAWQNRKQVPGFRCRAAVENRAAGGRIT